jgi:alanyl-tRNA synthetase
MEPSVVRQRFLDFFAQKGHLIVPSAPLVVKNDPTLLFTNAGMNQFKDYFLGNETPVNRRIADTQKCLRVSGKHNDLEEVGIDTYHHTMFEMLGNWSFGDYFKKEAIAWAWELLTEVYGLSKERLYITVFGGDSSEGLEPDHEAAGLWEQFVPKSRILFCSKKDNFWEMGDTGPCGPCSELHIDLRSEAERAQMDGYHLVNQDHPQVIEIWNLVFIQYNRKADGSLEPLPDKHVDTGMGFERLCRAIEAKNSNYDTGVFMPLIHHLEVASGVPYGKQEATDIAMRVIADHIRAVAFAIADGQLPSNNKAGYVIRRILRRAVRYGYQVLGFHTPFLCNLVPVLNATMGQVFEEIRAQESFIAKVIMEEESNFLRTLEQGLRRLEATMEAEKTVTGKDAFELYDTYGFPFDLTSLIARERGIQMDEQAFSRELEKQKERSRQAAVVDKSDWLVYKQIERSIFVGYDQTTCPCTIAKVRTSSGKKTVYEVVLDTTPFYAESGGQIGDTGWLESIHEKIEVLNTVKENDLIIHHVSSLPEHPHASFTATIDTERRASIQKNHTATHLLHAALRQILGTHVVQKGSLVHERGLRFDFAHFSKMTDEELRKVEDMVNSRIQMNISLHELRSVPMEQAIGMGAMALFGEKYGSEVRVIAFDPTYSVELCGGTHVPQTGAIGVFKILSESAVAAGVRRMEAVTASDVLEEIRRKDALIQTVSDLLKNTQDVEKSVRQLLEENQILRKQVEQHKTERLHQLREHLKGKIVTNGTIRYLIEEVSDATADELKQLSFELRQQSDDQVLVLASAQEGKALLSVMLSDSLVSSGKANAVQIVKEIGKAIQGGGGGQPFFATAGGKNPSGITEALQKAKEITDAISLL